MLTALLMALALSAPADIVVEPNPPVAGAEVTISIPEAEGLVLLVSDPLGGWHEEHVIDGDDLSFTLPANVPLLLVGVCDGDGFPQTCRAYPVVDAAGKPLPRSQFWQAYLHSGYVSMCGMEGADRAQALRFAEAAVEADPADSVARELLWRIQAENEGDHAGLLSRIDEEIAGGNNGRLVLAAARVRHVLGDDAGSASIATRYSSAIGAVQAAESARWADIVSTSDPKERSAKINAWMAEDPLSDFMPQCLQILAATHSAIGDYRSTAMAGMISLQVMPDDAMTLNGVAMAMAEGGFQLERADVLARRAVEILRQPGDLRKPPQLSERRWREELQHALAAALDTRGWVLTKLERWEDARSVFEEAIAIERNDEFYLHYGLMLEASGDVNAAREMLRKGARLGGAFRLRLESELARLGR